VSVADAPDAARTQKARAFHRMLRLMSCCVFGHALAVTCHRNGASFPLHAALLSPALLCLPSSPRPGIPTERLVSKTERSQEDPSVPMPRLQEIVFAADVLDDLLPQTAPTPGCCRYGVGGLFGSPANRTVVSLRQDLGHPVGRTPGPARDPLSCTMPSTPCRSGRNPRA